jgi:hypothetical protein
MSGKEGEPTAAEIEQAKKEFLASKKTEKGPSPAEQKAEVEKSLPPGVRLLDGGVEDKDFKILAHFNFGFDDVAKLKQIKLGNPHAEGGEAPPPQPGTQNPFDTPFGDLRIDRQGDTLLLTTKPTNPMEKQSEEMGGGEMDPATKKQMEEAFKGLRVAWKIETPFTVLESNATRREGKTLIWEYTLDTFEKMTPEQRAEGIRAKFRM